MKSLKKLALGALLLAGSAIGFSAPANAGVHVGIGIGIPGPAYYGPAAYGPPPWTPDWIAYCAQRHPSFNPNTGYFYTFSGQPIFCQ